MRKHWRWGLALIPIAAAFLMGTTPSSVTYDFQGPSKHAKTLACGSCVLGDANDDVLYINIGFAPQVFWCWRAPQSDGADIAERFMYFTGMNAGTAITSGMNQIGVIADHDSIITNGITIMAGAAADTVVGDENYCLEPNNTYYFNEWGAVGYERHVVKGVLLGTTVTDGGAVTDKLFWVAFP